MTKVFLDDAPLDVAAPGLQPALEAASAAAAHQGRIVVEATADGSPLPNDLLAEPTTDPLAAAELRFTTAEPKSMVRTVVLDVAEAIPHLRATQAAAAEQVQAGRMDHARTHLGEAMEIWSAAQRAVADGSALLELDLNTIVFDSGPVTESTTQSTAESAIESLRTDLAELQRALASDDPSALGDVLAYDLDQRAEQWQSLMHRMAEVIDAARD